MIAINVGSEELANKIANSIQGKIEIDDSNIIIKATTVEEEKSIISMIMDICRDYECNASINYNKEVGYVN